ncbi:MAG TPA: hypothetical protein VLJ39_14005 [Tepidisphaeraceae bacterium]|nr:hypothetical protein [Tepidisphaeraceae bacterium]
MDAPLTPELERLIDAEVKSGKFPNAGEFLTAALQHYVIARDFGETYTTQESTKKSLADWLRSSMARPSMATKHSFSFARTAQNAAGVALESFSPHERGARRPPRGRT